MNSFEKKLVRILEEDLQWREATPSLRLQVVSQGRLKVDLQLGREYRYYDLASLTKILFTVPAVARLVSLKRLKPQDSVTEVLGWRGPRSLKVRDLLAHTSGLSWWQPFFELRSLESKKGDAPALVDRQALQSEFKKSVQKLKPSRPLKSLYSDLDFILLGFLLEEAHSMPLLDVWDSLEFRESMPGLHFNSAVRREKRKLVFRAQHDRREYAPTEKCPWRKKLLQGEVHDDNTWAFGGVSTHAGLFGTIEDVTTFGLKMREDWRKGGPLKNFSKRALPVSRGDWALGFMMPTKGKASCGRHFSASSFGHTGFTGTSIWYDPEADLLVSLLSNRVHPTRENTRFVQLRPLLHDVVYETIVGR